MKLSVGVTAILLACAPALAQPPASPAADPASAPEVLPVGQVTLESQPVNALMSAVSVEDDGSLSMDELADLRGGEAIVIQHTTQTLTAVNTGNSVTGDTIGSGAVNLGSGAFNGYDGIGNFVINTGHNNNLQGSISVSITMTPQ
ncbi:MAG TPA: hypothetical protein VFV70_09205 [Hyphomonadaceae bacterium]|nr:hypothetical protein [Hyphomonadaceae bacterium]